MEILTVFDWVLFDWVLLAVAGFAAGVLNAIAGGGSFLTFPALVLVGLPPIIANATSAVAVFPGYFGGAYGFRHELRSVEPGKLRRMIIVTLVGGGLGSLLLLITPAGVFRQVVPWLLAIATLLFAFGGQVTAWCRNHLNIDSPWTEAVLLMLVCIYGGYFNGGLGIMMLALFSALGITSLHVMNGLKNGLSFVLSSISVSIFAMAGIVSWPQAGLMMLFATLGGYAGAYLARALPGSVVRTGIVVIGTVMSLLFYIDLQQN
jgi:hypothetical protein